MKTPLGDMTESQWVAYLRGMSTPEKVELLRDMLQLLQPEQRTQIAESLEGAIARANTLLGMIEDMNAKDAGRWN